MLDVSELIKRLDKYYPNPQTSLNYGNPFELLVATILSAQCTDVRVNEVTKTLFQKYRGPRDLAEANLTELEEDVRPTGFFKNKAKNLKNCAAQIVARFNGRVPNTLDELVSLPGVGRKTANCVLGSAYGIPGIVVDTHVARISQRLGLTDHEDPVKIEFALMELIPKDHWVDFSHQIILHGRAVCQARKPACPQCRLNDLCRYYHGTLRN
ncbi:MAG: endonuclease III [Deltaproteobacteria bacterium]|nr:endonuclease III [Deltaproteobacteria bacterium]